MRPALAEKKQRRAACVCCPTLQSRGAVLCQSHTGPPPRWGRSVTWRIVPLSETLSDALPIEQLHAEFEKLLPQVQRYALYAFRAIKCPHSREDAVAEVLGLAWRQFLHYAKKG